MLELLNQKAEVDEYTISSVLHKYIPYAIYTLCYYSQNQINEEDGVKFVNFCTFFSDSSVISELHLISAYIVYNILTSRHVSL